MKRGLIAVMCLAVLTAFSGLAGAQDAKAKGEKVYTEQKCTMCHSIAGKGNPKGSLDGIGSKLKPEEIREWIVSPAAMAAKAKATRTPAMPAKYKDLPKEEVDSLVAYLSSLKK